MKPQYRWGRNGGGYSARYPFGRAIQKYGWENIEHTILDHAHTKPEADAFERYYIKKFNTTDPRFGYNITLGGGGVSGIKRVFSEETRAKMSARKKGRPCSEELKKKLSIANKFHRTHSWTQESRAKLSEKHKKPVECIETGFCFSCAEEACQHIKANCPACIRASCRDGRIAYGFHWRYISKNNDV